MKYVEKKITESAEYAYLICRYEENKNNLSSQNTNTQYCKTTYDNKMSDVVIEYFTQLKNSNRITVESSTKLPVTDLKQSPFKGADSNLHWYKDKYSTPKFYINSKLSDKSIHKTYRF